MRIPYILSTVKNIIRHKGFPTQDGFTAIGYRRRKSRNKHARIPEGSLLTTYTMSATYGDSDQFIGT